MEPNVHKCNDPNCPCQSLNLPALKRLEPSYLEANYRRLSEDAKCSFWTEDDAEISPIDGIEWRDAE